MKLLLHYRTSLGPRTVIAEIVDSATAQAVRAAHEAMGESAALVEEMPRLSMADHLTRHRRSQARARQKIIAATPNISQIKRVGK